MSKNILHDMQYFLWPFFRSFPNKKKLSAGRRIAPIAFLIFRSVGIAKRNKSLTEANIERLC